MYICLVKLKEEGYDIEAIHFIHAYSYCIPTEESMRICKLFNVKLHIIDITNEIEKIFLDNFSQRPCRYCKGIMDKKTVEFAVENNFYYICVGDTASDSTLVSRVKEKNDSDLMISKYFNKNVELPDNIYIFRPLINYTNAEIFKYLREHGVSLRRNNDTGDKYFEYSREGCPLQFKDYGVPYSRELMLSLKEANILCCEFASEKGIKASVHLPSGFIVTIPKGYEEECHKYLASHGYEISHKSMMYDVVDTYSFNVSLYKEICSAIYIEELMKRLYERLGYHNIKITKSENMIYLDSVFMKSAINLVYENYRIYGYIRTLQPLNKNLFESLLIELFHTYNFEIHKSSGYREIDTSPLISSAANSRYINLERLSKNFIRSSNLDQVSQEDFGRLKNLNVTTIIDLRNETKHDKYYYNLFENEGLNYIKCPFTSKGLPKEKRIFDTETVSFSYMELVKQYDTIRNIFQIMAQSDGTIMYLCKYGRDRSGVISVLLELLADTTPEEIMQDYILSNLFLEDNSNSKDSTPVPLKKEWILEFINKFNSAYKNIYHYFELVGLSGKVVGQLKKKVSEK